MKSLLFDLLATQPNGIEKRHGGGKYGEAVFFRMAERGIKFLCVYESGLWLNPEIKMVCAEKGIPLIDCHVKSLCDIIREQGVERFYSALPTRFAYKVPTECEFIGTWHGLRNIETPKDWYFLRYKNSFLEIVKFLTSKGVSSLWDKYMRWKYRRLYFNSGLRFVTVSEHSRLAIRTWFPEYKNEVRCFYSPNTSMGRQNPKRDVEESERYLLLVSGNRWAKNSLRAIMAFDRLVSNGAVDADLRMKVTGCSTADFWYRIKNAERFDFLGYVDEDELDGLYAHAYMFIYPSLNEGFGYPPIEAMRYKVPVIASPFSSISEICGGSVLYFNPFSVEEIMNRMQMMMEPGIHKRYAIKGHEQYKKIRERQDRDLDAFIDYLIADDMG